MTEYVVKNGHILKCLDFIDVVMRMVDFAKDKTKKGPVREYIILRATDIPYLMRAMDSDNLSRVLASVARSAMGNRFRRSGTGHSHFNDRCFLPSYNVEGRNGERYWHYIDLSCQLRDFPINRKDLTGIDMTDFEPVLLETAIASIRNDKKESKVTTAEDEPESIDKVKLAKSKLKESKTEDQLWLAVKEIANNEISSFTLKTGFAFSSPMSDKNSPFFDIRPYAETITLSSVILEGTSNLDAYTKDGKLLSSASLGGNISVVTLDAGVYGGPLDMLVYWVVFLGCFLSLFSDRVGKTKNDILLPVVYGLNKLHEPDVVTMELLKLKANLYEIDRRGLEFTLITKGDMFGGEVAFSIT